MHTDVAAASADIIVNQPTQDQNCSGEDQNRRTSCVNAQARHVPRSCRRGTKLFADRARLKKVLVKSLYLSSIKEMSERTGIPTRTIEAMRAGTAVCNLTNAIAIIRAFPRSALATEVFRQMGWTGV